MKGTQPTLSEVKGSLNDLNEKLASEDGKKWLSSLNKFLHKEKPWEEVAKKLLKFLSVITVPAMERFIVKNEFVVGKNDIGWISGNFKKWSLNIVEEPVEKTKLRHYILIERSIDELIIEELGGKKKARIFLSQIFHLMKNVLQRDGTAYIFYAETTVFEKYEERLTYENEKGKKVVLCAVNVYWFNDGWSVDMYTVEHPSRWDVADHVFSRNS